MHCRPDDIHPRTYTEQDQVNGVSRLPQPANTKRATDRRCSAGTEPSISPDLLHALFAVLVGARPSSLFSIYIAWHHLRVESDVRSAGHVVSWLMDVPTSLLQQIAIVSHTVSVLIQLLIAKEWLQSVVSAIALILGFLLRYGVYPRYQRLRQ